MIWDMLGRDPKCFTGGECWDYHYPTRWLLFLGITISIVVIYSIGKHIAKKKAGDQEV
jgi:hypothetical protein